MELLFALAVATTLLVAVLGPNVALIVANTMRYGFRFGTITVVGATTGIAIRRAVVIGGLTGVFSIAASAMVWIKWLGVAYLVVLGMTAWRELICCRCTDLLDHIVHW